MGPLDFARLAPLMRLPAGRHEIIIGLIHGPRAASLKLRRSVLPGPCWYGQSFPKRWPGNGVMRSPTPAEVAGAIAQCADAGARVINLSAALPVTLSNEELDLKQALDYAVRSGTLVVTAAGWPATWLAEHSDINYCGLHASVNVFQREGLDAICYWRTDVIRLACKSDTSCVSTETRTMSVTEYTRRGVNHGFQANSGS